MKLINPEKAIGYAKEKDYIKTSGQEEAVREVFALATVEAVPIDVLDKMREEIEQITDTMGVRYNQYISKIDVLQIIDKYKAESEDKE